MSTNKSTVLLKQKKGFPKDTDDRSTLRLNVFMGIVVTLFVLNLLVSLLNMGFTVATWVKSSETEDTVISILDFLNENK
jgi:hypothetical protein